MEDRVPDSQQTEMVWVPDSQPRPLDFTQEQDIKVVVYVVIGVISTLVELIIPDMSNPEPMATSLIGGSILEDVRNPFKRQLEVWGHFLQQILSVYRLLLFVFESPPLRRILCPWYIKPRTIEWFYLYLDYTPTRDPERFRKFFRITPAMFYQICDMVREDMVSRAPAAFHCLPNRDLLVERQVAVAIRRLATGDQLLGIAELFGISVSTASKVTWKFCQAFCHRARRFLHWPDGEQMNEVKSAFKDRWGFPNCCGAIDVTHILIEVPLGENSASYYDWQHNISITLQAIVDQKSRFLDVFIGTPGSVPDARLLRTSAFYQRVVYDRTKLHGPSVRLASGYMLREYLLGDKGYPLYNWLIVPFPRNMNDANDRWNQCHSSARMCVERGFGRLKGTWRILSRKILRPKLDRLATTVYTCVLLHNMVIHRGDEMPPQGWNEAQAHPQGYANRPRRNYKMFAGGTQAREALQHSINA